MATSTPWGMSQSVQNFGRGINSYSTASHGGFKVSDGLNKTMPDYLRNADGWYEEDCEWAKVVVAFPDRFSEEQQKQAQESLRNWYPKAYEKHYGVKLTAADSFVRAEEEFRQVNAGKFQVFSALRVHDKVLTYASRRDSEGRKYGEERCYILDSDEYKTRRHFGFVIDESKHDHVPEEFIIDSSVRWRTTALAENEEVGGIVKILGFSLVIDSGNALFKIPDEHLSLLGTQVDACMNNGTIIVGDQLISNCPQP